MAKQAETHALYALFSAVDDAVAAGEWDGDIAPIEASLVEATAAVNGWVTALSPKEGDDATRLRFLLEASAMIRQEVEVWEGRVERLRTQATQQRQTVAELKGQLIAARATVNELELELAEVNRNLTDKRLEELITKRRGLEKQQQEKTEREASKQLSSKSGLARGWQNIVGETPELEPLAERFIEVVDELAGHFPVAVDESLDGLEKLIQRGVERLQSEQKLVRESSAMLALNAELLAGKSRTSWVAGEAAGAQILARFLVRHARGLGKQDERDLRSFLDGQFGPVLLFPQEEAEAAMGNWLKAEEDGRKRYMVVLERFVEAA
jgi:hypothetical protein